MKRLFFVLIVLYSVPAIFAQTDLPENAGNYDKLIVHNQNVFYWYPYTWYDGTPLKLKEARSALATVPENEKLLKQELGLRIGNYSLAALTMASLVTSMVFYKQEWEHSETVVTVAIITGMYTFLGELLVSQIWKDKWERAVYNYNFSIMGVPIPVKKK